MTAQRRTYTCDDQVVRVPTLMGTITPDLANIFNLEKVIMMTKSEA